MTKQDILNELEKAFVTAEKYHNRTFPRPKEIIFKRNGTTAGWSWFANGQMMFQLDFAEKYAEDYVNTIKHEAAHWVTDAIHGNCRRTNKPHGWQWKSTMWNVYGLRPDRCHTYDTSVTTTKRQLRFTYFCSNEACGKTFNLTTTKHNRMLKGSPRAYVCGRCKGTLIWNRYATAKKQELAEQQKLQKEIERLEALVSKMK